MWHDDDLLELVLDQMQQDINDGDVSAVCDMFGHMPGDILIGFLSESRQEQAVKQGSIKPEEIEKDLKDN